MTIGGIEQWITIDGEDRGNPVVLVLHGGPGVSNAPFASAFVPWGRTFTVLPVRELEQLVALVKRVEEAIEDEGGR